MAHYYIEKAMYALLPEFILLNIARRKSEKIKNLFYIIEKDKNFNYDIATFENKNDIKKHIIHIFKLKSEIIEYSEETLLLLNLAVERRTSKLNKLYLKIKKDKTYSLFQDNMYKCIKGMKETFRNSLELVDKYRSGGSTSINLSDNLKGCNSIQDYLSKSSNRLFHLRLFTSREIRNEYKKLKLLFNKYHSDKKKQKKHNTKIEKTITNLIKRIEILTKRFESIHHSIFESTLKLEKEYENNNEVLFIKLKEPIFSKNDIEDLKNINNKRKKQYSDFLNTEYSHLNTMSKEY